MHPQNPNLDHANTASSVLLFSEGHTLGLSDSLLTAAMKRLVQLLTDPELTPKMLATALTHVCNGKTEEQEGKEEIKEKELSDCVSIGLELQTSASQLVVRRFSCQHVIKRTCRIPIVPEPKKAEFSAHNLSR